MHGNGTTMTNVGGGGIGGFAVKRGTYAQAERILVYGTAGVGKSSLAAGAPAPFFVDLDRGSQHLDVDRNAEPLPDWPAVMKLVHALATERHPYQTIVIDTLDRAQSLCWRHICETVGNGPKNRKAVSTIEEVGGGYGKGYMIAVERFRELFGLLELAHRRGLRIILLAHAKTETVKNSNGPDYPRVTVALHEKTAALFLEVCDAVMYAARNVLVRDKVFRDDAKGRFHAIGGESRLLYTTDTPSRVAKNRYGLPETLPLDWDAFAEAVARGHSPALLEATLRSKLARLADADLAPRVERAIRDAGSNVQKLVAIMGKLDARLDAAAQARLDREDDEPAGDAAEAQAPTAETTTHREEARVDGGDAGDEGGHDELLTPDAGAS